MAATKSLWPAQTFQISGRWVAAFPTQQVRGAAGERTVRAVVIMNFLMINLHLPVMLIRRQ